MSECKNTHPEKNKRRFRDRPVLTRAAITLAWIAGTVVFLAGIAVEARKSAFRGMSERNSDGMP